MAKKSKVVKVKKSPVNSGDLQKLFLKDLQEIIKQEQKSVAKKKKIVVVKKKPRVDKGIKSKVAVKIKQQEKKVREEKKVKKEASKPVSKITDKELLKRIEIRRIKRKGGKHYLIIRDTVTGKRFKLDEFKKRFNLTQAEVDHITSREVNKLTKGKIEEYFKFFNTSRSFSQLVDVKRLDDLKNYKIVYNKAKISLDQLIENIISYEEEIERAYYKFMLNVNVSGGVATINLTTEIIDIQDDEKIIAYTDARGNFILFSS